MDAIEPEGRADGVDLADVEVDRAEGRVADRVRVPAALLIVEDDAAPGGRDVRDRLDVVVAGAGPAVQEQERRTPRATLAGLVADDRDPRAPTLELDEPLVGAERRVDRDEATLGHVRPSHAIVSEPSTSSCVRMQAERRPGPRSTSEGTLSTHSGSAAGQRGANAQPDGSAVGSGGAPGI
jgi:hypothetical protein